MISPNFKSQNNISQTEFDIGTAQLYFDILTTGRYLCRFSLEIVGNEQTEQTFAKGNFKFSNMQIDNLTLALLGSQIDFSRLEEKNSSIYSFFLNQFIPKGMQITLEGYFYGTFTHKSSEIHTYYLDIDWGTIIGLQNTRIRLDGRKFTIVSIYPTQDELNPIGLGMVELLWNEVHAQRINITVKLHPRESPNTFLLVDLLAWNATTGQSIEIPITNIGSFDVQGWIITPDWISSNTTSFYLKPTQTIIILFSISESASSRLNGSIEIISHSLWEPIVIPVYVQNNQSRNIIENPLVLILGFILIIMMITIILIVFHQKEVIQQIIRKIRFFSDDILNEKESNNSSAYSESVINSFDRNISENSQFNWESVHSKWVSILPQQELQVLEILFSQGSMNQQAIANKMGLSKVTVSRIISRLEAKRLLNRERIGVSKIIKLNKDHF
jgi:uncharacterized membrane protein